MVWNVGKRYNGLRSGKDSLWVLIKWEIERLDPSIERWAGQGNNSSWEGKRNSLKTVKIKRFLQNASSKSTAVKEKT